MSTWKPTTEELTRALAEQNPWDQLGGVPEALAPPSERALARVLWKRVIQDRPRRYQLILGPRRVGKTTAMYQIVRHLLEEGIPQDRLWWFRLDHPLFLQFSLRELLAPALEGRDSSDPIFVFLDELVYAKDWDLWLKTFYDERYPIRVVATSSATAALRGRRLESGVGRWEEQFLMPYLFTEFLDLAGQPTVLDVQPSLLQSIERAVRTRLSMRGLEEARRGYMFIGGFPELLVEANLEQGSDPVSSLLESQRVLRSDAIERAVYKDIPQSFGVESPMALERLLYTLAGQVAGLMSPKRICGELGISQPTFDKYVSYLERAFLVFTLPNYSGREAAVQKRGRKLYFVDGAVRNAALQRGLGPLKSPTEMGVLLENAVASHLHALSIQTQVRLFHWRDGRHEVDFVYDHPEFPVAVEVAASADHSRAGLRAFISRYPRFEGRCYLVTADARALAPTEGREGIGILPIDLFLVIAGRQAEESLAERLAFTDAQR